MTATVGLVAAGGRSLRMGRDKALLPWGDGTLLDHALARLRAVCADVRILCGPSPRYEGSGAPVVTDRAPGGGPLEGLAAALSSLDEGRALLLGVDLPFVTVDLLQALLARAGDADVTVPVAGGGPQPLCAVYARACLPAIEARIQAADLRMSGFWSAVRVRPVTPEELAPFGDPERLFKNLNGPEDYREARAR